MNLERCEDLRAMNGSTWRDHGVIELLGDEEGTLLEAMQCE
jgi:hypothetical protein